MADIFVFIVEDPELAKSLVKAHFEGGKITYAEMFEADKRERITKALDLV